MARITSALAIIFGIYLPAIYAHGVITSATGDQGGQGTALGVDNSTPRDGSRPKPFEQDTTVFEKDGLFGRNVARAAARSGCGKTKEGGENDVTAGTASVIQANGGLPQVSAGGTVNMTLHQVNADGAGPYECMVDPTGTGASFQPMTVTQNVDGRAGLSIGKGSSPADHPLVAQMPAGVQCTGTSGSTTGICMVRCQNPALAGPFGGCVPVQQAGAGAATGTAVGTGAAADTTGTAGTASTTGTTADTAGTADTGATGTDTGAADTGATGATDTGAADTGAADTGATDTGAADTGATGIKGGLSKLFGGNLKEKKLRTRWTVRTKL